MSEYFKLVLPEPEEIREIIKDSGMTRAEVARALHTSRNQLNKWLAPRGRAESIKMPLAAFELLLIKIGKHPTYKKF